MTSSRILAWTAVAAIVVVGCGGNASAPLTPNGSDGPAGAFEGELSAKDNHGNTFVYAIKGGRERITLGGHGGEGWTLFVASESRSYTVDDAKKEILSGQLSQARTPEKGETEATLTPAGSDAIAGARCEAFTGSFVVLGKHVYGFRVCVLRDVLYSDAVSSVGELPLGKKLRQERLFPLRLELWTETPSGPDKRGMHVFEVTKIERKSMPASRFELPENYQLTDMAEIRDSVRDVPATP